MKHCVRLNGSEDVSEADTRNLTNCFLLTCAPNRGSAFARLGRGRGSEFTIVVVQRPSFLGSGVHLWRQGREEAA